MGGVTVGGVGGPGGWFWSLGLEGRRRGGVVYRRQYDDQCGNRSRRSSRAVGGVVESVGGAVGGAVAQ